jgi:hypothetical protein
MTSRVKNCAALLIACAVLPLLHVEAQSQAQEAALARFPVAHEHNGSWCLGYLYIYPDSTAYDVTWPASDAAHSFTLRRSDVKQVGRWSRAGKPLKAVELKTGKTTYHLWWLADEQDVVKGRAYQKDPADAGDPDLLIAAIRDPATLNNGASAAAPASTSADPAVTSEPQQVPDSPLAAALRSSPPAAAAPANPQEMRFAVAHAHALAFCVGYLYVARDHVRYEVVQPAGDKKHAMNLSRREITAIQQWVEMGALLNAAEIRTSHGNYHFWLLPEGSDLANTPYRQWNLNNVVPVQPLIAALQGQN